MNNVYYLLYNPDIADRCLTSLRKPLAQQVQNTNSFLLERSLDLNTPFCIKEILLKLLNLFYYFFVAIFDQKSITISLSLLLRF